MPTGPHTSLRVGGTGGKEDTLVEEAAVTFTKHVVERRVSTQSELEALKTAGIGEDTAVESVCHFAAIIQKDENSRPFPVHFAAPPLFMRKARLHVCSQAIPGSNLPPPRTMTFLQLHCCCPLLLNLNGFGLTLQTVIVCVLLPGQKAERVYIAELAA